MSESSSKRGLMKSILLGAFSLVLIVLYVWSYGPVRVMLISYPPFDHSIFITAFQFFYLPCWWLKENWEWYRHFNSEQHVYWANWTGLMSTGSP